MSLGLVRVNGVASFVYGLSLALGLVVLVTPGTTAAQEKVTGHLIVEDVMARPGTPVTLKAALLEQGLLGRKGLGGETLTFTVQGQRAGTALTGGDGRAFLEFKTHMRGNHTIVAAVESSRRVASVEGTGNLASWERRRPILLVDVSTLFQHDTSRAGELPRLPMLEHLENLGKAVGETLAESLGETLGKPREHASHALSKLAEFYYNVIYLQTRQGADLHETRDWLRQHEFPTGITKQVSLDAKALSALMEQLREGGWDNLEAGIGHTWEFAHTLVKQRIKTVIFPDPNEKKTYPRRTKIVHSWNEVRKQL